MDMENNGAVTRGEFKTIQRSSPLPPDLALDASVRRAIFGRGTVDADSLPLSVVVSRIDDQINELRRYRRTLLRKGKKTA